jgi:uncharacterized protein (TIGR02145 family)
MKKSPLIEVHLFVISVLFVLLATGCKKDNDDSTVTDIDGNVYNTVTIGTQIWMKENLKVTKLNDGSSIPNVTDQTQWSTLNSEGYCLYDNNSGNKTTYGALYNWFAVNTNKLCPSGWRVPSDNDWTTLTALYGGDNEASADLKEAGTTHWAAPNTGTNESGFTGLPGGGRIGFDGTFMEIYTGAHLWSITEYSASNAYYCGLANINNIVYRNNADKRNGFSVRCFKN